MGRHLRTLTRRWTARTRRADGTLVPEALTGEAQRRATAALLGVPASQVSDAMIQRLFARVTTRTGALRRDAAARIQRAEQAPTIDQLERQPERPRQPAPPATRPTPTAPSGHGVSTRPASKPAPAPTSEERAEQLNERAAADGRSAEARPGLWARVAEIFERVGEVLHPNGI